MRNDAWQSLTSLESRDVVSSWFKQIHDRELNATRAREIMAAAKQGREYFENALRAEYSVKALFIFYGVSSLARSLTLLMMKDSGEVALSKGHGIETVGWSNVLSGSLSSAIGNINKLEVKTCRGLFNDFINLTKNRVDLHLNSSRVDISIYHPCPKLGVSIKLSDLLSRTPDLSPIHNRVQTKTAYAGANFHGPDSTGDARLSMWSSLNGDFLQAYSALGYATEEPNTIVINNSILQAGTLQAYNSFINGASLAIPDLHIVQPYPQEIWLSQLSSLHAIAYFLGMLCRYFPTHWMALMSGEKGDGIWPELYAAHKVIQTVYPELAIKFIDRTLQASQRS